MQKRFDKVRMIAEGNEMADANINLFKKWNKDTTTD
jgi:hypothetical protein